MTPTTTIPEISRDRVNPASVTRITWAQHEARHNRGFWTATLGFVIVEAYNTMPAPLYGNYRVRS